ncbi:MAG: ParA family protein [Chromatiaceae bacterium]|nr:ParA family protein [Gammaproteobacteria bacterium]MCP5414645.1 ParA family protein [Chromatiaceae bacterium]
MRIIAVVNQKGGVGKTTTAANLGHGLSLDGFPTLLLDLDPQAHLQHCLGEHDSTRPGMDSVLLGATGIAEHADEIREDLHLVTAGPALVDFEAISGGAERAFVLRDALAAVDESYAYVVMDCGPASGMLVANAIAAATDVLVPVAGDYLSLTGLARLLLTLRRMRSLCMARFDERIYFSRFTPRRRLSQEVYRTVSEHFSDKLLATSITEAAILAECAAAGETIFEYQNSSRSAREYRALIRDLLDSRVVRDEEEATSNVA